MKLYVTFTLEPALFHEVEESRGREKRSTFISHLVTLGLKAYKAKKGEA